MQFRIINTIELECIPNGLPWRTYCPTPTASSFFIRFTPFFIFLGNFQPLGTKGYFVYPSALTFEPKINR